ncbi:hypothetical protein [Aureimonas leprariae]|uniref:Uncharacterized protein n=1 Tax=Plantimonas leprariae TaxID=2615207 RepID=A0A7V7PP66_9HYPH|nr:hypothetical protein [Aureimonas leprariae]KAB0679617.1 hypothetical protein F6X38_12400 [Aureimonas leprariae]
MADTNLSDKALSILAFAAYHALASGEKVRDVVLDDGKGHKADAGGVEEMTAAGLLEVEGARGRLTEAGERRLEEALQALRGDA